MHYSPRLLHGENEVSPRKGVLRKNSTFTVEDLSFAKTKKDLTIGDNSLNDNSDLDFIDDDPDLSSAMSDDDEIDSNAEELNFSQEEMKSDEEDIKSDEEDIKSDEQDIKSDEEEIQSASNDLSEFLDEKEERTANVAQMNITSDLATLKKRIEETVYILMNFSKARDPNTSRPTYCNALIKDLCLYYGYSEYLITEHFFHMFSVAELIQFLEASDVPRPVTIRTNTLKIKRRRDLAKALIGRGINVDPLAIGDETEDDNEASSSNAWSALGLQVFHDGGDDRSSGNVPLGATPEYLSGLYMLQAAASFLPVVSLAPAPGERVLDMCAAPGGKSTHCSQLMKNSGLLLANDLSKDRQKATAANIYRLGVRNAIISVMDGRQLPSQFGANFFDKVLLDAPCSGTGVISKDPTVKVSKEASDFKLLTHTQKELILTAIDLASANDGVIVYSTCSVCVEENEEIVQYALEKRPNVKLVETRLPFGRPGYVNYREKRFSSSMKLTMRYYPHVHNLDGFYVARFIKTSCFPNPAGRNVQTEALAARDEGKSQ
ncbi:hypothetical protein DI09_14p220 [Mitosporidium daphniae]|uniref:SAM-dependent MTase RsmB/NOP-type domain-containing protein n=1 Tax=Mitosporidium daphniae TaxID=1485682 RepID=A0A098VUU0_9MICR|nr:uncharacterized protein DI09_14p220 [Mitosporidium daphniae]KGG52639.1 hypothetical protein DI09_14p220 [Mitosporidium daphniae]|eukprot:XP_013239066.1 uncharacterized protein DI09_14p220 [Mitosporidium daphniae]